MALGLVVPALPVDRLGEDGGNRRQIPRLAHLLEEVVALSKNAFRGGRIVPDQLEHPGRDRRAAEGYPQAELLESGTSAGDELAPLVDRPVHRGMGAEPDERKRLDGHPAPARL